MQDIFNVYDIHKTWRENLFCGPKLKLSKRFPYKCDTFSLWGYRLNNRLGIPAGPLLSSKYIKLASYLGYSFLTYKTIRGYKQNAHLLPNVMFAKQNQFINDFNRHKTIFLSCKPQAPKENISITNSFGNPSLSPDFLVADIKRSKSLLCSGQILCVSIYGDTLYEFEQALDVAMSGNPHAIELNLSCPNIKNSTPLDPYLLIKNMKRRCQKPLIVKVGSFLKTAHLKNFLLNTALAGADGVCGINTIPMKVKKSSNQSDLDYGRTKSGICGHIIKEEALKFVTAAHKIIYQESLPLVLLGCGGITKKIHINEFLNKGCTLALMASSFMWNPFLAKEYVEGQKHGKN